MRLLLAAVFAVAATFAGSALAQDVPGRVGRISLIEGSAALYQDPDRGWEDAYVNSPVTSRNSVWTDPDARAEVVVGPIALRLDEASQLDVSQLDDAALDAILERGTVAVRIRHFRSGNVVRLSTPQASFLLRSEGRYRLDADPDRGESRLSVFAGTAALETANGSIRVTAGQSVAVWSDDGTQYAFQGASATDFDRWAVARDARWVERRAPEFVSYEMTGYEDLDSNGEWGRDPVYGAVWYPTRVQDDWAPYRYGRWTFVRPWGWTWVDAEPWGYAPFHYGRWVHVRDRWAWCPGRREDRPAWAPALVGFIGGGDWSASVASSGGPVVGWYPLAPSEAYRPWYPASSAYVTRVNAVVRNVPQAVSRPHVEWNRDRGATVVRREALVAQRPVQQARVNVASDVVRRAPIATAPMNILPSRDEVHRAERDVRARSAPAGGALARRNGAAPSAPGTTKDNALARPSFAKPSRAPRAAARGAAPPPASPVVRSNPPAAPAASPPAVAAPQPDRARATPRREEPAPKAPDAQRERASGEAQQRAVQEQERARSDAQKQQASEAQRQSERAAGEAERQRTEQAKERSAREAQQSQQRAQQQEQQRAREAAQQQQKAGEEQQRAAREAAQQQQRGAQEQQRAIEAQQRRAAEAPKAEPPKAQPPKAQPQKPEPEPQKAEPRKGPPTGRGPPEEREKRDEEGKRGRGEGG